MAETLLIVDDNPVNLELLQDFVIALGFDAITADNGRQALETIRQHPPDLLLLDIMMPEMDGYQVLEHLQADSELRHIPVIMISAMDELDSVVRCIELGADDYLLKPYNPMLLKARVGASLEKKRLRDSERQLHAELAESFSALQRAEQARDGYFHMIVHDLKSPLAVTKGFVDLIMRDARRDRIESDRLLSRLTDVSASTEEMLELIGGILDLSRLESGDMPISPVALDAVQHVHRLARQFAMLAENRGIQFDASAETGELVINADAQLLDRVLQNLLSNALKFTPQGATIRFKLDRDQDSAVFTVADSGPGIPEQYREKIFEKFFQVGVGDQATRQGVGLGLAFCKAAVEAMQGRLWVGGGNDSGAEFRISFPLLK